MSKLVYVFLGIVVYLFFGNIRLENKINVDESNIDNLHGEISALESRIEELEG